MQYKPISPKLKVNLSGKKESSNVASEKKFLSKSKNQKSLSPKISGKNIFISQKLTKNNIIQKNHLPAKESNSNKKNMFSSEEFNQRKKVGKRISPNRENETKKEDKKVTEFKVDAKDYEHQSKKQTKVGLGSLR